MQINCDNFISLLQENAEAEIPESFKKHLENCDRCKTLLKKHNCSFEDLKKRLTIKEETKNNILSRLQKQILREKALSQNEKSRGFWARLSLLRLQTAISFLAVIVVVGLFFIKNYQTADQIKISGSATILKNFEKIVLENNVIPVSYGEKISLLTGKLDLLWKNNEKVIVEGRLDFLTGDRKLTIKSGHGILEFTPSATGYVIATRKALFTIIGTTVIIDSSENSDSIGVVKGKIAWTLIDKTRQGEATAGTKVIFKNDQVIEENFSIDPVKFNGGVLIKNGGIWTPLNKD